MDVYFLLIFSITLFVPCLTRSLAQFTDLVLEFYRVLSWRVDLPLSTCATTYWLLHGTSRPSSLATGTFRICADMDPCQMALCSRGEHVAATVSLFSFLLRSCYLWIQILFSPDEDCTMFKRSYTNLEKSCH